MYYVNKIIGWAMSPIGILFLGIACGAILGGVKRWRKIREVLTQRREDAESARPEGSSDRRGAPRVLLVTSAWHMPRAKMLFERAGLEVVAAPCDYEMHYAAEKPIEISDFFPSADCSALCRNSAAIKEWVARAGYRLLRR